MIRQHRERGRVRIIDGCTMAAVLLLPWVAQGGEVMPAPKVEAEASGKTEEADEKKKKKKIPPFKCSAWCSFRDFGDAANYDSDAMRKKDEKFDERDESRAGANMWGGYARRGQWVSLVVELQNTTEDKPYVGNIRVQLDPSRVSSETGEKPYTTRYRQSFELAPKSTQSFNFCVLCPEFDFSTVDVLITANGYEYPRSVRLRDLDAERRDLIVVVSDRAAAFSFLMKAPPKSDVELGPQAEVEARSVAVVQPSEFPNRWYNLTLANLIIIDGPPRDGLSDEQIDALRGYCQAGGHVLISSGLDPARLRPAEGRAQSIADLVGFRVRDLKRVKRLDCAPGWIADESDTGLPVVDVTPNSEGGEVVVDRNAETGLVERMTRRIGMGTATFFAFSLSEDKLKTWPERAAMPLNLLEDGRRRTLFAYQEPRRSAPNVYDYYGVEDEERVPQEPIERFREQLDASFSEDTPVETPKRGVVASFLLLYLLVAVPLNYFIFGWFRRREIAWAAVPVWALFFSIGAYVVGYQQGRLTVDQLSVVEAGPNQTQACARTFMGVFAPRRGDYQFRFDRNERLDGAPQAGPAHLVSRRFQTRGITGYLPEMDILEEPNGDLMIEDLLIYARSTRRLELQHRTSLGKGIEVKLTPQGEGKVAVSIQNRSSHILLNAVLAYRGGDSRWRVVRVGNLPKNMANKQDMLLSMGPSDGQNIEDTFFARPPYFASGGGQTSGDRAKALGTFVQSRMDRYQDTLLLAWMDGGMLPVSILRGDQVQEDIERGMTLLLMPVGEPMGGGRRNWSGRFTTDRGSLARADWEGFALKNGPVRITQVDAQTGETNLELYAPVGTRNLRERQFSLAFQLRAMTQQEYAQREGGMYNNYNNMPSVPTQYAGEIKVEICQWKSDLTMGDYHTVFTGTFRQLKAGGRQSFAFKCKLEDRDIGRRNTILMRIRLVNMSARGEWSEVHWPLDLLGFEPEVTGRDAVRR